MDKNELHVPNRMAIIISEGKGDIARIRRTIELVMVGQYKNRTDVVRAGLDMLFESIDRRRAARERVIAQEED